MLDSLELRLGEAVEDELGLRPLTHDELVDLYEVIRLRYERDATVITPNRDEQELHALFGDPLLVSAAMDRLLHHSHIVRLEGDSYRNKKKRRLKKNGSAEAQAS